MREQILNDLKKCNSSYFKLVSEYGHLLPQKILDSNKVLYEEDIPNKVNTLLDILNREEDNAIYPPINNIEEAIATFENANIQYSMNKVLTNIRTIGIDMNGRNRTNKEILQWFVEAINSGASCISDALILGKLAKGI